MCDPINIAEMLQASNLMIIKFSVKHLADATIR